MTFRSNHQCYGLNHGIVCDNVPILHTHMHLGMAYDVAGGSFPSHRTKKPISSRITKKGSIHKRFNTSQKTHQWFNT